MVPRQEMETDLKSQEKDLTDDINNLNKKVRSASKLSGVSLFFPGQILGKTIQ